MGNGRKKMTTIDMNPRCQTCGNTWLWHQDNRPQHPFNDGTVPWRDTFGQRSGDGVGGSSVPVQIDVEAPTPVPGMFDPVLRQALIDKGILTPQDLRDAEDKIAAVTNAFTLGRQDGSGQQQSDQGIDAG